MAEFDGLLLREQKALEDKQRKDPLPDRSGESAGGSAGGEGGSGEGKGQAGEAGGKDDRTAAEKRADAEAEAAEKRAKAGEAGQKADEAGQKAGEAGTGDAQTADTGTGGSTDAGRLEGGTPVTAPVEGGPAGPGSDSRAVPADVGDGKDDDVVARQLREAATNEKDPAIREKLWEEYRETRGNGQRWQLIGRRGFAGRRCRPCWCRFSPSPRSPLRATTRSSSRNPRSPRSDSSTWRSTCSRPASATPPRRPSS